MGRYLKDAQHFNSVHSIIIYQALLQGWQEKSIPLINPGLIHGLNRTGLFFKSPEKSRKVLKSPWIFLYKTKCEKMWKSQKFADFSTSNFQL